MKSKHLLVSQMAVAGISCYSTCGLNASELGEFLAGHGIDQETVQNFIRRKVCGDAFSKLTEEDLKEFVPLTRILVQVRELRQKVSIVIRRLPSDCVRWF